jgi:putative membrane protein
MNMYDGYHFGGMHLIWWFIWMIFIFWIFATPYYIPGQMYRKDSPFDILRKRFASGQITKEEYQEHKALLEKDFSK